MAVIEEKKEEKKVSAKGGKTASKKKEAVSAANNADTACKVLVEPWITEKTHAAIADNKYTFKVIGGCSKQQAKMAIEGIYGVKVEKITALNVLPKKKAYGRYMGKKQGIRKATVTLKKGDKIELFQGA